MTLYLQPCVSNDKDNRRYSLAMTTKWPFRYVTRLLIKIKVPVVAWEIQLVKSLGMSNELREFENWKKGVNTKQTMVDRVFPISKYSHIMTPSFFFCSRKSGGHGACFCFFIRVLDDMKYRYIPIQSCSRPDNMVYIAQPSSDCRSKTNHRA